MMFCYIDSKQHPEEWIEAMASIENGGDIHEVEDDEYEDDYAEEIAQAEANPGVWF